MISQEIPRPPEPAAMHQMNDIQEPAHYAVWPRRVPREIPPVATTLWHNLEVSAQRYPDEAALVFFGQSVSYRQLEHDAQCIAGWLERSAQVAHGDRVLLMMQNSPQFVIAAYAILRAGAVVVPVNPMSRADELAHYIEDPKARAAIVAADLLAHLEQGNASLARLAAGAAITAAARDQLAAGIALRSTEAAAAARPGCADGPLLHLGHHRQAQGLHAHASLDRP
jgi:acyl-CoA synthetase (AMP-forming)/AMP-acid ligase II